MNVPVAIVGAGLAGLWAAALLRARGVELLVLEARDRIGGRILTVDADGRDSASGVDLGPSWFWPDLHPEMARIVGQLGLEAFAQHDDGDVLVEHEPGAPPRRFAGYRQEPRSMRLVGGTAALVRSLAARLPPEAFRLGARVTSIAACSGGAVVAMEGDRHEELLAAQVILAVPPRLAEHAISFEPPIDVAARRRWQETATWMAPHAKFVALFDRPFWRSAGLSGTAQSMVGPLAEIHDATTGSGNAALFGFVGVGADRRAAAGREPLKKACLGQLVRLFGEEAATPTSTLLVDWSAEPFTATVRDRTAGAHPLPHHGAWIGGAWQQTLSLAGSETSTVAPGYLAGAFDAAERAVTEVLARLGQRVGAPPDVRC